MRNVLKISSAVLMLASASVAQAQTQATVNFGYRGNDISGDVARMERYRDLRDGPVAGASYINEHGEVALTFNAANVGFHDQSYAAELNKFGKLKVNALWNSIPLNYAYNTLTPWVDAGDNRWTLDPATRTRVQSKEAGVIGIGTNAAAFGQASIYRSLAQPFEMAARRDILDLGLEYQLTQDLQLNVGFASQKRGGNQPWGAAFSFNNANELPLTIDDRTNDITAGLEWAKKGSMLRVEWLNSRFENEFTSLTWDSPLRATDFNNGKTPPTGPYDPSAYLNGNGPAMGRMALTPSSQMNSFTFSGLQKLANRSSLTGNFSFAKMTQDEDLLPWTTNTVINSPVVLAAFPGLASLPRSSAEAEIQLVNAQLNFVTRPTDALTLNLRYRYTDRNNKTPEFDYAYNVRFDAVPEATPGMHTKPYNITRNTFDAGATLNLIKNAALGFNYIQDDVKREHRVFGNMTDYTFRLSLDTYGNQFFTIRTVLEKTDRVGHGFDELELEHGGMQLGARFYDEAEFARKKGSLIVNITPSDKFDLGLVASAGTDEYDEEEQEFGLLDNSNSSYNATLTVYPSSKFTVSGNYGYDKYTALQESRNANPSNGSAVYDSWFDENRDWSLDNEEIVKNYGVAVDLLKALPNIDVRLSYDRSESDNEFVFGGPRIQELRTNQVLTTGDGSPCGAGITSCFDDFAPVTNDWQQLGVSFQWTLSKKLGLGLGYNYEKFEIVDFATTNLADGTPRIDPLGALTTGYGNRPYKGSVFTAQLSYTFQSAGVLF